MKKIDLHIHSTFSDGKFTPTQIIDTAKINNVKYISITDHDSIKAYTKETIEHAKTKGITLIKGVEISTKFLNKGIHILGYNIDINNKDLLNNLSLLENSRINYFLEVSARLNELGYTINKDKLLTLPTITKAHIALDIIENPTNKNLLLETFSHIPSKGEFIETLMNEGCIAYVEKFSISAKKASQIIKGANGKVVLAHPVAYIHEDNSTKEEIQSLIEEIKPDGIEAYYLYVDKNNTLHDEISFWKEFAQKNNLFSTIGSDFHAIDNIRPQIGFTNTNVEISEEDLNILIKKVIKH